MKPPLILPPKPASRPEKTSFIKHILLFRKDIISSQPAKLYRAKMAEFRTPFFRSYLVNQPDLVKTVLQERPDDFPKARLIAESLKNLLGNSVFVTNGEVWKRQRRIIDPSFEGGRLKEAFGAMLAAGEAGVARFAALSCDGAIEVEAEASHMAADVIFRTLFSIPISDQAATDVFRAFRDYQRTQPLLNLASFIDLPRWMPRFRRRQTLKTSRKIRRLLNSLTSQRMDAIANNTAPNDLATKIMTTRDPETGETFDTAEMVDQVAIFFLAGHETSASALGWCLYLLALDQEAQARLLSEVDTVMGGGKPIFSMIKKLTFTRDVFREGLRLYPPVPMMIRSSTRPEEFRNREIKVGSHIILSPWHLHRHEHIWENPDHFDPDRWQRAANKRCQREAYIPFSAGARACPGAGFAMIEGVLLLALLVRAFHLEVIKGRAPMPVAHLTVRAKDGIWLKVTPR
jgi:cytochrome P450